MNLTQYYENNKKLFWIVTPVVIILLAVVITALVMNSYGKAGNNENKNAYGDNNGNQLTYLPSNTCPDRNQVFNEGGELRADLNGKPYLVKDSDKVWVERNCITSGQATDTPMPTLTDTPATTTNEPPLLLKSIGFKFDTYNPATLSAGDMKFTKTKLQFDQIFSPFGQPDPRNPGSDAKNPQPVFILPLGTNVLSLVDGEVVEVKQIYSGDYTVMVAQNNKSPWIYETEHIKNPTVKIGDKVTAGQVLGIVSDYDTKNTPGFGLVEIGILHAGAVAEHVCPFRYMDSSIKSKVNSDITKLYTAWETYLGKNIYNQETHVSPGCVVETAVKG